MRGRDVSVIAIIQFLTKHPPDQMWLNPRLWDDKN